MRLSLVTIVFRTESELLASAVGRVFLDEPESSKQSRSRTWNVLQKLRSVLSETGNVVIPPPAQKTFDSEGAILEHALTKSLRIRNEAIKSLCSSVRRFRDAPLRKGAKTIVRTLFRICGKRLHRAENLIQD